jgi:CDP-paratose synthetase
LNILLTGATGFLGSALAKHWTQAGNQLTMLVRPTSSLRRVQALLPAVRLAKCTRDSDIIEMVQEAEPDVIVHTACAYGRLGETALEVFDANVRLGMLLLEGVLRGAGGRVGFISTDTVLEPSVSNYALSKQQFAQWGAALAEQNPERLQFVNIRLQHMFGPGDDPSKFASHVLHACLQNQPKLALTAGEQRRDFIYIEDVVSAYDIVAHKLNELSVSEQLDVGSGNAPSVRSFVEQVHALTGSRTELQFGAIPFSANGTMLCQADTRRLQNLGWQPAYSLERGIQKMIELEFVKIDNFVPMGGEFTRDD